MTVLSDIIKLHATDGIDMEIMSRHVQNDMPGIVGNGHVPPTKYVL